MKVISIAGIAGSLCCALCIFLAGCGGGGGGGGDESDRGARLMHASLDDAPVSLKTTLDPGIILQTGRFLEVRGFTALPEGTQQLSVEGGQAALSFSESFDVQGNEKRSLLFYRSVSTDAVQLSIIEHPQVALTETESAIRIVHAAAGAAVLEAAVGGAGLETAYGGVSEYALVPSGTVSYVVRRQVDQRLLVSENRTLEGGKAYSVLVAGRIGEFVASRLFID